MTTELKQGKIIITLETEREIEVLRTSIGTLTFDKIDQGLKENNLQTIQPGEIPSTLVLYNRLKQLS